MMFQGAKNILSQTSITILIVIISIAGRVTQKLVFTSLDDDKCYQLQATQNLVKGQGITIHKINPVNYFESFYEPLIKWPPAFSFLNAPFYALSGKKWLWGSIWLDILTCIAFILMARAVLNEIGQPLWSLNIFTIITGFYLYDFVNANSTDFLAFVFYLLAFFFTLRYLKHQRTRSLFIVTAALFMTALTRYMYLPVIFIIPAYLVFSGYAHKKKELVRSGLSVMIATAVLIGSYLLIQEKWGGSSMYIAPSEKGLYPGNLTRLSPFLFTSFGHLGLPMQWMSNSLDLDFRSLTQVVARIHLFVFAIMLGIGIFLFYRSDKKPFRVYINFYQLGFLSIMAVVATLAFLSLTNAPLRVLKDNEWTFIVEPRYFAVPVFFTQLIIYAALVSAIQKKIISNWLAILFFLPITISTAHGIYFTTKSLMEKQTDYTRKPLIRSFEEATSVVKQFIRENPGTTVICASGDPMFNNYFTLMEERPCLYDVGTLNAIDSHPGNIKVIIAVRWWFEDNIRPFLENPNTTFYKETDGFKFYVYNKDRSP